LPAGEQRRDLGALARHLETPVRRRRLRSSSWARSTRVVDAGRNRLALRLSPAFLRAPLSPSPSLRRPRRFAVPRRADRRVAPWPASHSRDAASDLETRGSRFAADSAQPFRRSTKAFQALFQRAPVEPCGRSKQIGVSLGRTARRKFRPPLLRYHSPFTTGPHAGVPWAGGNRCASKCGHRPSRRAPGRFTRRIERATVRFELAEKMPPRRSRYGFPDCRRAPAHHRAYCGAVFESRWPTLFATSAPRPSLERIRSLASLVKVAARLRVPGAGDGFELAISRRSPRAS